MPCTSGSPHGVRSPDAAFDVACWACTPATTPPRTSHAAAPAMTTTPTTTSSRFRIPISLLPGSISSFLNRNPTRSRALLFQDVAFLGHAYGRLRVLFEQKPLLDEAAGRILHSRHEPRVILVALLEGFPGIACAKTLGLRARQGNEAAAQAAEIVTARAGGTQVPAEIRPHRHLDVHRSYASQVSAVFVDHR